MKIEAGKFYRTRNGQKIGPLSASTGNHIWPWNVYDPKYEGGCIYWYPDGQTACYGERSRPADGFELTAEWGDKNAPEEGPVIVKTRTVLVPGRYGSVIIGKHLTPGWVDIRWNAPGTTAAEIRAAAAVLTEVADALDAGTTFE